MNLSLTDFAERLEDARLGSGYVLGKCIFHDDTHPSLWVGSRGRFKCFACGVSGTWQYLWSRLSSRPVSGKVESFPHHARHLAGDWADYIQSSHEILKNVPSLQHYLEKRKIAEMIEPARLGWDDGWYVIPVTGRDGKVEGVVWRADSETQKQTGMRYLLERGAFPSCFHSPMAKNQDGGGVISSGNGANILTRIVVVFGMLDALSLGKLMIASVTTTAGKSSFRPEWLDYRRGKILIVPDKGEEETARELARRLDWRARVVEVDWPEGCKDVNDLLVGGYDVEAMLGLLV